MQASSRLIEMMDDNTISACVDTGFLSEMSETGTFQNRCLIFP